MGTELKTVCGQLGEKTWGSLLRRAMLDYSLYLQNSFLWYSGTLITFPSSNLGPA